MRAQGSPARKLAVGPHERHDRVIEDGDDARHVPVHSAENDLEVLLAHAGDEVAEPVHVDDRNLPHRVANLSRRSQLQHLEVAGRRADLVQIHPQRKLPGHRCEDVAPVKSGGHLVAEQPGVADLVDSGIRVASQDVAEDSVVRTHEAVASRLDHDAAPLAAHSRIDDGQEYGAWREGLVGRRQRPGPGLDVVGGNFVRDIHDRRVRAGGKNRSPNRAYVVIARTEVGNEGNCGPHRPGILPYGPSLAWAQAG